MFFACLASSESLLESGLGLLTTKIRGRAGLRTLLLALVLDLVSSVMINEC